MLCKLFVALGLIGLVAGRAYDPPSPSQRMNLVLTKECSKFGGRDALQDIETGLKTFSDCFNAEMDDNLQILILRAKILQDQESITNAARSLCAKKNKLEVCFFNLMDAVEPCVDPRLRNRMNDSKIAVQNFGNYICENDAEIVSKLFEKEALQCLEDRTKMQQIQQCVADIDTSDIDTLPVGTGCDIYWTARTCLLGTLRQCRSQIYADFIEKLSDTVVVGSYCENKSVNDISDNTILHNEKDDLFNSIDNLMALL